MAVIDVPALPSRLYRYRSITRSDKALKEELEAITEGYIYCSDFTRLNDPMEGSYDPSTRLSGSADYRRIVKAINDRQVDVGIASFSEVKHSELMWTHYTGNHTGICISYYAKGLFDTLPNGVHLVRVGYSDSPPLISAVEAKSLAAATRKIFSQKKVGWQYEREWRILAKKGKVRLKENDSIRSVYLGTRIDPSHRFRIVRTLLPLNIPIYAMEVRQYEHVPTRIKLPPRRVR
jgi:hypothetical protein